LKQAQFSPLPFEEQTVSIFAGTNGYLDGIATQRVTEYEAEMLSWMRAERADLLADIRNSRDLSDDARAKLKNALDTFGKQFA
jgi:F-type H+-transporting ATPase subunit alpha